MMTDKKKVYAVVATIPKGKVMTYGQVARLAGIKSPRWVGRFLHVNPDPTQVPCHRVVRADGKLAENFGDGGMVGHKEKLTREGVKIARNRVNLKKFQA
ncbi:MGMT family protein [Candidatus Collierbacteria bacterium]|nr:MGMT family protein [Candidatus Collierbacteria bacterium]